MLVKTVYESLQEEQTKELQQTMVISCGFVGLLFFKNSQVLSIWIFQYAPFRKFMCGLLDFKVFVCQFSFSWSSNFKHNQQYSNNIQPNQFDISIVERTISTFSYGNNSLIKYLIHLICQFFFLKELPEKPPYLFVSTIYRFLICYFK